MTTGPLVQSLGLALIALKPFAVAYEQAELLARQNDVNLEEDLDDVFGACGATDQPTSAFITFRHLKEAKAASEAIEAWLAGGEVPDLALDAFAATLGGVPQHLQDEIEKLKQPETITVQHSDGTTETLVVDRDNPPTVMHVSDQIEDPHGVPVDDDPDVYYIGGAVTTMTCPACERVFPEGAPYTAIRALPFCWRGTSTGAELAEQLPCLNDAAKAAEEAR